MLHGLPEGRELAIKEKTRFLVNITILKTLWVALVEVKLTPPCSISGSG